MLIRDYDGKNVVVLHEEVLGASDTVEGAYEIARQLGIEREWFIVVGIRVPRRETHIPVGR